MLLITAMAAAVKSLPTAMASCRAFPRAPASGFQDRSGGEVLVEPEGAQHDRPCKGAPIGGRLVPNGHGEVALPVGWESACAMERVTLKILY